MRILVAGKGGTGKTIVAGLIVRSLIEEGAEAPILAVDADPDSNLGETLGVSVGSTLGDIREELSREQRRMGPEVDKRIWLESRIFEILVEGDKFDLLAMGRPEGPGCYCAVNNILRNLLDSLANSYRYVVIDAEAGLEHISRRTAGSVDEAIIVTDFSLKGFRTAKRMMKLAESLGSRFGRFHLIANRVNDGREDLARMASQVGLSIDAIIPEDSEVSTADREGRSVFTLDPASKALSAVKGFVVGKILEGRK